MRYDRLMSALPVTSVGLILAVSLSAGAGFAAESHDHGYGRLGAVQFPVSCNDAARKHIDQGLALLHHMTYEDAEVSFAAAAKAQPDCAMSYWGQAMTYIHPLWSDPPSEANFARGRGLVAEAKERGEKTARENAYIAALDAYYAVDRNGPESRNLLEWHRGWQKVHQQFPDDPEAALFFALSQVATADPSDKTFAQQARAGALAEKILAKYPDHPGAHHYVIHAYDYPPLAERALVVAREYGEVAPDVPHALHMPSHIFTRLGLWPESIAWNTRSADAALAHAQPGITSNHYLHALDYLVYAYLQRAQDQKAKGVVEQMKPLKGPFNQQIASPYSLAAAPARLALERQQWAEAVKLSPRMPDGYPWDAAPAMEAITHFARALGAARGANDAVADISIARLEVLRDQAAKSSAYWSKQIEIQRLSALAWLRFTTGDRGAALGTMEQATELEASTEKHPVTPGEVLPARELLGDMLLEMGHHQEALTAYTAALARSPNRLNSLYGAGRAAELAGDKPQALLFYQALVEQTAEADTPLERIQHAKDFLDKNRTAVAVAPQAQ
jgi:tetratricopeptide (TPR) repeat protein